MDAQEKDAILKRMKKAIRAAREDYRETRGMLSLEIDLAFPIGTAEDLDRANELVKMASQRGMLARDTQKDESGRNRTVELAFIPEKEPYEKRPSLRALKKARGKDNGGPDV